MRRKISTIFSNKVSKKIYDPCNDKEHHESFLRKKNTKSVKRSKIITQQAKPIEIPKIIDIKLL